MAQKRSLRRRKGFNVSLKSQSAEKTQKPEEQPPPKTMFSGKDLKRKFKTKHMPRYMQLRLEKLRKGDTRLRQIYLQDLRFHRYRPLTIKMYLDFLLKFFAMVWKGPEQITDEDLRKFFRYIEEELRWSNSYLMGIFSAIKFFFDYTCPRKFKTLELYRQPHPKTFPEVFSQEEIRRIFSFATDVRYHAYLVLVYSCGLRANEALRVKFSDIDARQGLLRITDGKGGKSRMVPIPQNTIGTGVPFEYDLLDHERRVVKRVSLPTNFAGIKHGWVTTSHAAQGMTSKNVVVAAERMAKDAFYVSLTRGKFNLALHIPDKDYFKSNLLRIKTERVAVADLKANGEIDVKKISAAEIIKKNSPDTTFLNISGREKQLKDNLRPMRIVRFVKDVLFFKLHKTKEKLRKIYHGAFKTRIIGRNKTSPASRSGVGIDDP